MAKKMKTVPDLLPPATAQPELVTTRKKRESTKPVETLDRKVAALGEHHAAALKVLSSRDPKFKKGLREEMGHDSDKAEIEERIARHESAARSAKAELAALKPAATTHRDRLDRLAKSIAEETLALPS